jgi:hypothetical protein
LLAKCQTFSHLQAKIVMAWHQWANRSQYHIATSIIRTIRGIFNGLEASHLVSSLLMPSSWLLFACKVPNFQPADAGQNCHGLAPMSQQEPVPYCNTI